MSFQIGDKVRVVKMPIKSTEIGKIGVIIEAARNGDDWLVVWEENPAHHAFSYCNEHLKLLETEYDAAVALLGEDYFA